jgi:hypothetical protein
MMLSSNAVDRCRYRLETTAELIAVGLLESGHACSATAGGKKSVARRSGGLDYSSRFIAARVALPLMMF